MNHIDINVRIHCRTYSVIVHRVMKDHVDTTDEAAVRKVIEQQNNMLHAGLCLQCITWSKRALQTGKKYRSMIVKTASAEEVNALIEKGLSERQDIKTCELFERGCRMTQCFNCQQYEHTDRVCKMSIKCRHCAESHDTKVCSHLLDKIKRRCMICMKSGHEAWVNICEACIEQKERTRIAFFNKSVFYPQQTQTQSHVQHTQRTNVSSTAQSVLHTEYTITLSASASASTISHSSDTLSQSQKQSLTDAETTLLNWSISTSSWSISDRQQQVNTNAATTERQASAVNKRETDKRERIAKSQRAAREARESIQNAGARNVKLQRTLNAALSWQKETQ